MHGPPLGHQCINNHDIDFEGKTAIAIYDNEFQIPTPCVVKL